MSARSVARIFAPISLFGALSAFTLSVNGSLADSERFLQTKYPSLRDTDCSVAPLNFSTGPPNAVTGAPGDKLCANPECHSSFPPNVGGGSLSLAAPSLYFPTDTHLITITLEHPGQIRWGFEITALDTSFLPVGTLLVSDTVRTQKSTVTGTRRQYIKHTSLGTDSGVVDSAPGWSALWAAPADYQGDVIFYGAGNGANGNGNPFGDFIHTDSLLLQISDTGIRFAASTKLGPAPLNVGFNAIPLEPIESQEWSFGDGATSTLLNPAHTFAGPGMYSVSLSAQSANGSISWTAPNLIAAYADTISISDTTISGDSEFSIPLRLRNFLPLSRITTPVKWNGDLILDLQEIHTTGLRAEGMRVSIEALDTVLQYTVITVEDTLGSSLPPGNGTLFEMLFSFSEIGLSSELALEPIDSFTASLTTANGSYTPQSATGSITYDCCETPGDANDDGAFNIADITFSIARIFSSGPAPLCCASMDANSDGAFNIADVTYGISHIFVGGPAPICGTASGC